MGPEKRFENKVKNYLKSKHIWHVKYFANRNTKSGVPDILACVNGNFVGIEIKDEKGKASHLQYWNREYIRESGGISIILYPSQFDEFTKMIDYLLYEIVPISDLFNQMIFDRE